MDAARRVDRAAMTDADVLAELREDERPLFIQARVRAPWLKGMRDEVLRRLALSRREARELREALSGRTQQDAVAAERPDAAMREAKRLRQIERDWGRIATERTDERRRADKAEQERDAAQAALAQAQRLVHDRHPILRSVSDLATCWDIYDSLVWDIDRIARGPQPAEEEGCERPSADCSPSCSPPRLMPQ